MSEDWRFSLFVVVILALNRAEEDTFEMYLRYIYRYMKGCIFCIF